MPRTIYRPTLAYALFTFLSCFLELGILVDAVARDRPLWEPGLLLLAFHGANLLTYLATAPGIARVGSLVSGSLLLLVLSPVEALVHPGGVAGTAIGVLLAKLGIQWMRNDLKMQAHPGGTSKALPRLAGFILAFLYSPLAFAAVGLVGLGVYLLGSSTLAKVDDRRWAMGNIRQVKRFFQPLRPSRIQLAMAAHSAHYFAFGYGVPILFAGRYGFPVASLGLVYTAGWLGYYLISRLLPPSPRYLAWGHLVSALAILALAFSPGPWPALLAWTVTGFGGGTIFMLPHLRASNPYDPAAMDLWDNGANLFGLLPFLWAWGRGMPALSFLAAASLTLVSAWAGAGLRRVRIAGAEGKMERGRGVRPEAVGMKVCRRL